MGTVIIPEIIKAKVADLIPYPDNPRVGNVALIAESLKENGQFRPLIVQKSTNYVLGGNHTLLGAKKLRWKTIDVCFVDVDDDKARKIVLADNRTSDLATYNVEALTKIINDLDTPDVGTGYSASDITNLLASVAERDAEIVQEVISGSAPRITFDDDDAPQSFTDRMRAQQEAIVDSSVLAGDEEQRAMMLGQDVNQQGVVSQQQALHAEIQAKVEAHLDVFFPSSNYWGIPDLKADMLVDRLPDPIDTWAGQDTTPDDGATTWLLNWGSVSSKGIPWDRTILGFYSHDARWAGWYESPGFLIGKVIAAGVTMSFQPENSAILGFPRYFLMESTYNSNWLARLMQEMGIRIIPTLRVTDHESIEITTLGLPKKPPILALQSQQKQGQGGVDDDKIGHHTVIRAAVKLLDPGMLVVYGGPPAHRLIEDAKLPKDLPVKFIENFSAKRNQALKPWHADKKEHDKLVKEASKKYAPAAGEEPQPEEDDE